jgi:hypothetical protein
MEAPLALQELDLTALVGRPVAEAREAVEAAGGALRTVAPGGSMTMDFRSNRVTLAVVDETVVDVVGRG